MPTTELENAPKNGSQAPTQVGYLEAIWIKPAHRQPMEPHPQARMVAGRGLEGNINQGGKRQITVLDAVRWQEACNEVGAEVAPILRRANLFIRGLDLELVKGRILEIGTCRLQIRGWTAPCRRMDEAHPGLRAALGLNYRGGLFGEALDDGDIRLGDPVRWL